MPKKIFSLYLKKTAISHILQLFPPLKQDLIQTNTLVKKYSFDHYISYVTLVTYVPVLGGCVILVSVRYNVRRILAEDVQNSEMVSGHTTKSQALNKKIKLFFWISCLLYKIFLLSSI